MMILSPTAKVLIAAGMILTLVGIFATVSILQRRQAAAEDARLGINREEVDREERLADQLAMALVTHYLGAADKPTFVTLRRGDYVERIPGRGKYYRVHGHVRALNGQSERATHSYTVEIRFDPAAEKGFVCHSVYVGGGSLYSNPYIEPRQ